MYVEWDRVGLHKDYGLVTSILHVLHYTVDSEIFPRVLFSRIALKDILVL